MPRPSFKPAGIRPFLSPGSIDQLSDENLQMKAKRRLVIVMHDLFLLYSRSFGKIDKLYSDPAGENTYFSYHEP